MLEYTGVRRQILGFYMNNKHRKARSRDFKLLQPALDKHGFRQVEFAAVAGTNANTVNNWAKGHTRIPSLVWLFLDLLDMRPELKHFLLGMTKCK